MGPQCARDLGGFQQIITRDIQAPFPPSRNFFVVKSRPAVHPASSVPHCPTPSSEFMTKGPTFALPHSWFFLPLPALKQQLQNHRFLVLRSGSETSDPFSSPSDMHGRPGVERKRGRSGNSGGEREAVARAMGELEWDGRSVCSLGFHKGLPASQSVSHKSPRVVLGVVCWSFPVNPVTIVLGRVHHSREHIREETFDYFPLKSISLRKKKNIYIFI